MISLNIATHKARESHLKVVLDAVLKQNTTPDVINVYLNDYKAPKWLKALPITIHEAPEGDLGASAKFYMADKQAEGVYITLDDDLIPNPAYIGYMADMAYQYDAIVGLHGSTYQRHPVSSYYNDETRYINYCYNELSSDKVVDMLGSGVLAFKIGNNPTLKDFPEPNMTDPYLCKWAKENARPLVCLQRVAGFVKEISQAQDSAIWKGVAKDDSKQTAVINSIKDFTRHKPTRFDRYALTDASITWRHLKLIASKITKQTKVVEFGSGASTAFFSRYTDKLYSIEHNEKYHKTGVTNYRPIKDGWYDLNGYDLDHIQKADIIVIDGPIGSTGQRYNMPIEILPNCLIFVDDCHREKDLEMAQRIAEHQNRTLTLVQVGIKIMGIIK